MTKATLPPEIWTRVIEKYAEPSGEEQPDLSELWMSHRFVSRTFKTAVEDVFRHNYLQKTFIRWDLGMLRNCEGTRTILGLEYEFDSLIENRDVAVFGTDAGEEQFHKKLKDRLRKAVEDSGTLYPVFLPKNTVQIGREIFDSPIPGLEVNYDDLTITFDWKALFTRFFGEERHYHRMVAEFSGRQEKFADELKSKMQRGEIDMGEMLQRAFTMIADWSQKSYKKARRARISRTFEEQGDKWDWETLDEDMAEEEKDALEMLAKVRQFASMEESDDEESDEESDEDEDEDENEEDEWEDEEIVHD